jgi:hypothetical protein
MKTTTGVDKLLSGTIARIGQHADVDNVLAALVQGKLTDVPRPPGVYLDAVKAFRKRSNKDSTWTIRARLGNGTQWTRQGIPERELLTTIKGFHGAFAKMGRERGRA